MDNLITTCANDMWSAWTNSNTALQQRVTETTDAHNKLQSHLAKTQQEIYDQEKHIAGLQKAIRDKEAPLKVCSWLCVHLSGQVMFFAQWRTRESRNLNPRHHTKR